MGEMVNPKPKAENPKPESAKFESTPNDQCLNVRGKTFGHPALGFDSDFALSGFGFRHRHSPKNSDRAWKLFVCRVTMRITAMIGTARNAPPMPQTNHQNSTPTSTATGLSLRWSP